MARSRQSARHASAKAGAGPAVSPVRRLKAPARTTKPTRATGPRIPIPRGPVATVLATGLVLPSTKATPAILAVARRPWLEARAHSLAWLGLAGAANFLLALLALHFASLGAEPEHMSQFANTRFRLVWDLAVYSFTIGGAALSLALGPQLSTSLSKRMGVWLLWLAVVGAILLGAFPMDKALHGPTLAGIIHGNAAFTTFMLLGVAMVVLAPAFKANPCWRPFARASLILGILVTSSGVTYLVATLTELGFAAFTQRLLVGLIITWFIFLAVRLIRMPSATASPKHAAS